MRISKKITIDSEMRISGTTSNFAYKIPNTGYYTHCCVLGCNIPISYYLIQNNDNTFILQEEDVKTTIAIPAGNYNVISFSDEVTRLLNENSPHEWVYKVEFDNDLEGPQEGKFQYIVEGHSSPPSLIFYEGELHTQFGFDHDSTNTFDDTGNLYSTTVVNFVPKVILKIWSDLVDDYELITLFHDNAIPYSNISFQCQTDLYSSKLKNNGKDSIYNFSLVDKNGREIDLNGNAIVLSILLYRDTTEVFEDAVIEYIKYKAKQIK